MLTDTEQRQSNANPWSNLNIPGMYPSSCTTQIRPSYKRTSKTMKLNRLTAKLNVSLRPDPSYWEIELGLSGTWTLELPPPPVERDEDAEGSGKPVDPGGMTMGDVGSPGCTLVPRGDGVAAMNSSTGEGIPLDPCPASSPTARDVIPFAPTTGVASTASDVRPLAPTIGVSMTAGEVRPLAAAMGVEKTAREVRPLAPMTGDGMTAREVSPLAPAMGVKTGASGWPADDTCSPATGTAAKDVRPFAPTTGVKMVGEAWPAAKVCSTELIGKVMGAPATCPGEETGLATAPI